MEQEIGPNFTFFDMPKIIANLTRKVEKLESQIKALSEERARDNTLVDRKEAAKLLDVSLPTLAKLTQEGRLAWYKCGLKMFYSYFDIREYSENRKEELKLRLSRPEKKLIETDLAVRIANRDRSTKQKP